VSCETRGGIKTRQKWSINETQPEKGAEAERPHWTTKQRPNKVQARSRDGGELEKNCVVGRAPKVLQPGGEEGVPVEAKGCQKEKERDPPKHPTGTCLGVKLEGEVRQKRGGCTKKKGAGRALLVQLQRANFFYHGKRRGGGVIPLQGVHTRRV